MAYLTDYMEDEKLNQPKTGNAPTTGTAPSLTASQGETKKTNSGTGWTNLQNYLGANQGAGDRIGDKIGEGFDQVKQTADKEINDSNSAVSRGIQSGNPDLDLRYNFDPRNVSQADFNAFRNVSYQGPTSFNSTQGQNIDKYATGATTSEGRKNLVKNVYQRDDYTSGQQNFDTLLLQGSQKGMDKLGGFGAYQQQYNANVDQAKNNITDAKNRGDQSQWWVDDQIRQVGDSLDYRLKNVGGDSEGSIYEAQKKALEDLIAGRGR